MTAGDRPWPPGYEFRRILGTGGFGEVSLATQVSVGRYVAIKRLHDGRASAENVERFRREGQLLARTDHPAITKVYDLITHDDSLFLVMEYVAGDPLSVLMGTPALSAAAALVVLHDVADALAAASALGVVHRDVKPGNVFVLPGGHAKLGDFGLARMADDDAVFKTQAGPALGTPAYFAPELSRDGADPDERSDAYAFAVMAYEALVGQRPFIFDDVIALITAHWRLDPPDPVEIVEGFPREAADALLAGLAKDPAHRLMPRELVRRLEQVPADEWPEPALASRSAASAGPASPTVRTYARPRVQPDHDEPARSTNRRVRVAAIAIGCAVLLVGGVGAAALLVRDDPDALSVKGVTVTSDVATTSLRCPRSVVTFTGKIATSGSAGTVTYQWLRPDGSAGDPADIAVKAGQGAVIESVLTITGRKAVTGDMTLLVIAPVRSSGSQPVAYRCANR